MKIGSIAKIYLPNIVLKKDGIIIPNQSIIQKFSIPGVFVLIDGKAIFSKIEIIKQNQSFSEVNGLNIGDIIITDGKENIYDGELLK